MQLDQTKIVIRERSISEIFDLALHILRQYFKPLVVAILIGYGIVGAVNWWLCHSMLSFTLSNESIYSSELAFKYMTQMCLLFFITQPLASIPVTLYLGQALFTDQPNTKKMFTDFVKMLPQVFWSIFIVRGPALFWFLWWIDPPSAAVAGEEGLIFIIVVMLIVILIVRGVHPFVLEIILLEQNSYSAKNKATMTTRKRNRMLHALHSGVLMWRFIVSSIYSFLLLFAACVGIDLVYKYQIQEHLTYSTLDIFTPIVLCLIGAFLAIVRFLGYLDLRIRNEGWEVELLLRAEGTRLEQQLV